MEEVRQLVQEEGREARNLVAFHVAVDNPGPEDSKSDEDLVNGCVTSSTMTPSNEECSTRVSRKPPRAVPLTRRAPPRVVRLRSASAGRDKRSDMRARYWALLFGDLHRSVGEIYNFVDANENVNECQEVILVLENYTRDFKALGEWFRLKWEYDNTPPPQRPQSLAWEIRKTDFVRLDFRRAYSAKSSPSVSGKNSPCFSGNNTPSGKNSPNLTGKASPGSGKISPRISSTHSSTSPKANIEFFSSKIVASKITTIPEPKTPKEVSRLSDIKEKDFKDIHEDFQVAEVIPEINVSNKMIERNNLNSLASVEVGKAKEIANTSPTHVVIKSPKHNKTQNAENATIKFDNEVSSEANATILQLDAIENAFLEKHLKENAAKNENMLNKDKEIENNLNQLNMEIVNDKNNDMNESHGIVINTEVIENSGIVITSKEDVTSEVIENKLVKKDYNTEIINQELIGTVDKQRSPTESPTKSEDHFADISNESSPKCNDGKPPDVILNAENNERKNSLGQPEIVKDLLTDIQKHKIQDENSMKINITDKIREGNDEELAESGRESDLTSLNNIAVKEEPKKDLELKKSEIKNITETKQSTRPAYSTAAAKPKTVITKTEAKTPLKSNTLVRSSTVVEMRPNTAPRTQKMFQRKNQTNKCSYPFNLTTGRKSLFDNSPIVNKAPLIKKPFNRNTPNLGSGDIKMNIIKPDVKKRPPRPTSLKISEKGDKKTKTDKNKPALQRIKDCDEYSSCDTIVTQIDMSRIDSSESLKTLVPEDIMQDMGNSVEVLALDDKKDNEGWLTVKSRRCTRESKKQSKSHWVNRFHKPSATTSLPTLNMLVSPKQETKSVTDIPIVAKIDRAQSEQPSKTDKAEPEMVKVELKSKEINQVERVEKLEFKEVKITGKSKSQEKPKDLAIIRQKSDVTGLKTRSSKSKVLTKRAEKVKDATKDDDYSDLTKNRLHSSLESLTTGLARSQESTEEAFDFDKWKAEFKSTFNFLEDDDQISNQNELLMSADPSEMSEIAEMTSQIEENERKISLALDFQSEVDQRKLCEEEDLLNRQIMELQQVSDIDLDTETDDTETDAEILCEDPISVSQCPPETLGSLASLEDQYETALAGMSWAERMDALVTLEALVARDPGRAQQLHSKLSQGIRRRGSLQDVLRRIQAKQARADRQRQQLRTERASKIHQLLARVEEVKLAKNQLTEEKRLRMERRLQKAAENRDQHLKDRVRKAHDEEEKLREIAFIKQLEAENRRHDFLAQCRSYTTRLRQRRRDQLKKLEEKAAREAAVGARRQALQEARQQHVALLLARRKERSARVEELKELKRQERDDAAREKAEGVKSRLSALAAAAKQEEDALRSRIRDKQDASQQRLESHLQAIREKATGPRQATTSESHDQATRDMEEAHRLEQERKEREKLKTIKKKARKLKQKLLSTGNTKMVNDNNVLEFEAMRLPFTNKFVKIINSINNSIKPLQDDCEVDNTSNGREIGCDEDVKNKKKNKKLVNGNLESVEMSVGDKKKRKKSKESAEREIMEIEKINGDVDADIETGGDKKKKRKKESSEREIDAELEKNNNDTTEVAKESKKKKKKNDNEKKSDKSDKLMKTSSVCSSLSDMSRSSVRERKAIPSVDVTFLERQLNELNRIVEKLTMTIDKRQAYKTMAVTAVEQVLAVATEREDISGLFTPRCLTTAVTVACRAAAGGGSCNVSARQLVTGNMCVHLVILLASQLEKELTFDPKEMELARQLTDCLSVALDAVLCTSRVYDEQKNRSAEDTQLVGTLRNRAHAIISYFCLSGCLARAEKAGEARESIRTLLTVCADLCHPCDADIGSERLSARQSLRCALGSSVFGTRAEFCMLFDRGAELAQCVDFVRAARTAHLLRAIAEMDHQIVQESFGEGGWPLEFRAAVARLLSQHAPNDKEAPRTVALRLSNQRLDQTISETMVLDLIVLIGLVVVNNPQLQETICDGWSVIKTLCTLPANWFVSRAHSSALLPTLMALAETPSAKAVIAAEVNMEIVEEFMESPEAQKVKLVQIIKQAKNKKTGKK